MVNIGRGNTWQAQHFLVPAECTSWAAYCMKGGGQRTGPGEVNHQNFNKFVRDFFMREMRQRGMTVSEPNEVAMIDVSLDTLYQVMEVVKSKGLKYVLIAHPDSADEVHRKCLLSGVFGLLLNLFHLDAMKLYERRTEITTQGLKIGTVQRVLNKPQPQTVQNIGMYPASLLRLRCS